MFLFLKIRQCLLLTKSSFNTNRNRVLDKIRNGIILIPNIMSQNIQPEKPEYIGKEVYLEAGADYVITSLSELKELIRMINSRIVFCERRPD